MPGIVRLLALALVSAGAVLITAAPVSAAPPRVLEGHVQVVYFQELSRRVVGNGNVTLTEYVNRSIVTGGVQTSEPQEERARCVIRTDTLTCHGTVHFTGSVDGLGAGTQTSRVHVTCDVATGACTGRTVPVSGTGALARTSGQTTFTGNLYTGSFQYRTVLHGP